MPQQPMGLVLALVLAGIALVIYISLAVIFWRNAKLSQPWKAIFALTICPVFIVAMVVNIWFTDKYAGWLLDAFASATERGSDDARNITGFVASSPIALLICFAWYGLMRALDALTEKIRNS